VIPNPHNSHGSVPRPPCAATENRAHCGCGRWPRLSRKRREGQGDRSCPTTASRIPVSSFVERERLKTFPPSTVPSCGNGAKVMETVRALQRPPVSRILHLVSCISLLLLTGCASIPFKTVPPTYLVSCISYPASLFFS